MLTSSMLLDVYTLLQVRSKFIKSVTTDGKEKLLKSYKTRENVTPKFFGKNDTMKILFYLILYLVYQHYVS